ncbi:oligosaccharide flippase family protein [Zhaonella formicivorans]|uniref:oligosaccharide flippase family protein n=1 Tax=Zhaonella formicivorans TaxID=2528593 RepID=UPI0010D2F323|nr:oligosaccharide flippase family protein [Zhaonella formicivorans]
MLKKIIQQNKLLSDLVSIGFVTVFAQMLSFVSDIWVRKLLGPEQYGIWLTLSLAFIYGQLSHLGVLNAINREIPFFIGKNDLENVKRLKSIAFGSLFGFPLLLSLLLGIGSTLFSFIYKWNNLMVYSIVATSIILFIQTICNYGEVIYKSEEDFSGLSKLLLIKIVIKAVLTILFVKFMGFPGLFWGLAISLLVELYLARKKFKHLRITFNFKKTYELSKIGFPILLVGTAWTLITSLDRVIISFLLSPLQLGYYSIALITYSTLMMITQVVNQVIYPKFPYLYGKTNNKQKLKELVEKLNMLFAPVISIVVGLIYIFLPLLVKIILPEYLPGIIAAQILVLGVYPITLVGMAGHLFNTLSKQGIILKALGLTAILNIILSILMIKLNYGIEGVAVGTSIAYLLYMLVINYKALIILNTSRVKSFIFSWSLLFPLLLVMIPIILLENLMVKYILKTILQISYVIISGGILFWISLTKYKKTKTSGIEVGEGA